MSFTQLLGQNGIVGIIGIMLFVVVFRYSQSIFAWFESKTNESRTYINEKLEFLFIDVKEQKITYLLMGLPLVTFLLFTGMFGSLGFWATGMMMGIILALLSLRLPKIVMDVLVMRRVKAYQAQMVDALTLLSNGLRAGLSVPQSLGMVVGEMPAPINQEFNVILQQNRIGVPLEECFENLVKRVPLQDNEMFVSSVNILRETGGNLAEVFDTIVEVIRERIRLQQKVDTFTAQGMFQGFTLFAMPFIIGALFFFNDPAAMMPIFTSGLGIVILLGAFLLDCIGMFFILKIVKIKI